MSSDVSDISDEEYSEEEEKTGKRTKQHLSKGTKKKKIEKNVKKYMEIAAVEDEDSELDAEEPDGEEKGMLSNTSQRS